MPNLVNSVAQPGRGKGRAVPLRSGNDPSILQKRGRDVIGHSPLPSSWRRWVRALEILMWPCRKARFSLKKAPVWTDSPFLGGLAAPCLHCPREGTRGDPCLRTPAHQPFSMGRDIPRRMMCRVHPSAQLQPLEKAGLWGWRKASGSVLESVDVLSPTLRHGKAARGLKFLLLASGEPRVMVVGWLSPSGAA